MSGINSVLIFTLATIAGAAEPNYRMDRAIPITSVIATLSAGRIQRMEDAVSGINRAIIFLPKIKFDKPLIIGTGSSKVDPIQEIRELSASYYAGYSNGVWNAAGAFSVGPLVLSHWIRVESFPPIVSVPRAGSIFSIMIL